MKVLGFEIDLEIYFCSKNNFIIITKLYNLNIPNVINKCVIYVKQ